MEYSIKENHNYTQQMVVEITVKVTLRAIKLFRETGNNLLCIPSWGQDMGLLTFLENEVKSDNLLLPGFQSMKFVFDRNQK